MIFVKSPFEWRHAVTFDLFQGKKICCVWDLNSLILLVAHVNARHVPDR